MLTPMKSVKSVSARLFASILNTKEYVMSAKTVVRYMQSGDVQQSDQVDVVTFNARQINPILFNLLTVKTPSGHEQNVIPRIVRMIKGFDQSTKITVDGVNNLIVEIGERGKDHSTMFSCHTDTVHREQGALTVVITNKKYKNGEGFLYGASRDAKTGKLKAEVLGADDRAGIYLMLRMIQKKVPGLYVFHTWEESGAKGSKYILEKTPKLLEGIKRCIAFDRRGYSDVITNQRGQRCCSDNFGKALAAEINLNMSARKNPYTSGVVGMFTDSATYLEVIPECTNISVGYFDQHTSNESLDYVFLQDILLPAVLRMKWETLITERDPKFREYRSYAPPYQAPFSYSAERLPSTGLTLALIMPDGKLLEDAQLRSKLDMLLDDFQIIRSNKVTQLAHLIKSLYLLNTTTLPKELTAADEVETPEIQQARADDELPESSKLPAVIQHGALGKYNHGLANQVWILDNCIKQALDLYNKAEEKLQLSVEFQKAFNDTVIGAHKSIEKEIKMWQAQKLPVERVLQDQLELLISFLLTCGFMHGKTTEMAAVIEDIITIIINVSDSEWVKTTSLPKFTLIPEKSIIFAESDPELVVGFESPCVKQCKMNALNSCSGCGRTEREKKDWPVMNLSDKESVWIATALRKHAYKDLNGSTSTRQHSKASATCGGDVVLH